MNIDLNKIKKPKKTTTSISIDEATYVLAKKVCLDEDLSFSGLVEILLKDFLKDVGVK